MKLKNKKTETWKQKWKRNWQRIKKIADEKDCLYWIISIIGVIFCVPIFVILLADPTLKTEGGTYRVIYRKEMVNEDSKALDYVTGIPKTLNSESINYFIGIDYEQDGEKISEMEVEKDIYDNITVGDDIKINVKKKYDGTIIFSLCEDK